MILQGCVSEGSGAYNEDAAGFLGVSSDVSAAWVLDGVTGINERNYLPGPSDAAWLVGSVCIHLRGLASSDLPLPEILASLVRRLQSDWRSASASLDLPDGYDFPAACLILVKRYEDGWKALRLGDSILVVEDDDGPRVIPPPESDLGHLENFLRDEARRRRSKGIVDFKSLLKEFHPRLMASRKARNTASNHSILVADQSSLNCPEYIDLGWPKSILVCTDGFYRAIDTYRFKSVPSLLAACRREQGVNAVLREIRRVEQDDPHCEIHLRFKPADDASAVMLVAG